MYENIKLDEKMEGWVKYKIKQTEERRKELADRDYPRHIHNGRYSSVAGPH